MRYLGIDYGTKRIGLALSDEAGRMAFPHSIALSGKNALSEIVSLCMKEKVGEIVIGESKDFSGEPNKVMKKIEVFREELKKNLSLPIHLEPEYFSSAQAEVQELRPSKIENPAQELGKPKKKNATLDASAAAIILQSFLDKKQNP